MNMSAGNYQNRGSALPSCAGYSRAVTYNCHNPMSGRAGATPMGVRGSNYGAAPQDRASPSRQWQQQALPLPSASQMMPFPGGDTFPQVSQVTSSNKQGK